MKKNKKRINKTHNVVQEGLNIVKNDEKKQISIYFLYPLAILLFIATIFAFYNLSKTTFELWAPNDFAAHLAEVKFAHDFGIYGSVPYWNGGVYKVGQIYGVAYYTLGAFVYELIPNLKLSFIVTQIVLYILGFVAAFLFCKVKKYSIKRTILFYLLFFCSPISISYFLGLGSVGSLLAWPMIFFMLAVLEYFKEKKVNWWFLIIIIPYSIAFLCHMYISVLTTIIIGWYIFYKLYKWYDTKENKLKEIIIMSTSALIVITITSFWWIYFIIYNNFASRLHPFKYTDIIQKFHTSPFAIIYTFVMPLFFIIVYILTRKQLKKEEKIFYILPLTLSILMFTRIIQFVPFLNRLGYENICLIMLLFGLILLFEKKISINKSIYIFVLIIVMIITITSASFVTKTYYDAKMMKISNNDKNAIEIVERNIKDITNLVAVYNWSDKEPVPITWTVSGYFPAVYNITTPQDFLWVVISDDNLDSLFNLKKNIELKDCTGIFKMMKKLNTTALLVYDMGCSEILCDNFKSIDKKENVCLYKFNFDNN
ncbi:MAG: 6-pyruvoyl-tetrahydropterin synthase-related protein [Candidatus Woesearchaeota archaeon]|jgi:hypothetical protein